LSTILFNTFYNWIKYKTLPPSVLFKNRLYIERDSKHRRVMTNMGTSFRSSKWTSYNRQNISLNMSEAFLKNFKYFSFLLAAVFIFLVWKVDFSYSFLWFILDSLLTSFVYWYLFITFCLYQIIFKVSRNILTFFWLDNYKAFNFLKKEKKATEFFQETSFKSSYKFSNSKSLETSLLYRWLELGKVDQKSLSKLFNSNLLNKSPVFTLDFVQKFYNLTYRFQLLKHPVLNSTLEDFFNKPKMNDVGTREEILYHKYAKLLISYLAITRQSLTEENQHLLKKKRFKWNLYNQTNLNFKK